MLRFVFFAFLLPIVHSQYGNYANYGQNLYYNRCFNYCGYNQMSSYPTNNYGYAFPRPGIMSPYGQASMYGYDSSGFGLGNMGSYGVPYASGLQGLQGLNNFGNRGVPYASNLQGLQGFNNFGGGMGTMDSLAGSGSIYGSPGYNSGLYSGTIPLPFMQQAGFQPPMLREPFMLGPDGLPFMGDMSIGSMGVGSMLPRPFNIFDEGNIFNSPYSSPYRKPISQSKVISSKSSKTDHPSTDPLSSPATNPKTASNSDTYSTLVSLDQLINEMDKLK